MTRKSFLAVESVSTNIAEMVPDSTNFSSLTTQMRGAVFVDLAEQDLAQWPDASGRGESGSGETVAARDLLLKLSRRSKIV